MSIDCESNNNTVVVPLLACDKTLNNPDSIYVNPRNSSVTNANDHLTYGSSVVKKIHYNIDFWIAPEAKTTNTYQDYLKLKVQCMPLMIRYDDLDKEAIGESIATYIPLTEHGSDEKIRPDWSGTDLDTTYASDCWDSDGLTTDAKWESVAFDEDAFETALGEKPISKLLRSVTNGGLKEFTINKANPLSFNGTIRVPKKVQLQTEHTFYGVLISVPKIDDWNQYYQNSDTTGFKLLSNQHYSYYEWNKEFNQNVS